jgi:hypothetical protein
MAVRLTRDVVRGRIFDQIRQVEFSLRRGGVANGFLSKELMFAEIGNKS